MDRVKIYPESHGRAPLVALGYDQRQLAQPKELLIDYTQKELWLTDKNDPEIFYNLTSMMASKISTSIDASKIYIELDNIGTVRLKTYLEEMSSKNIKVDGLEHSVNVLNSAFDNRSIECVDGLVQVAEFDTAPNNSIPMKQGDTIRWITLPELKTLLGALK